MLLVKRILTLMVLQRCHICLIRLPVICVHVLVCQLTPSPLGFYGYFFNACLYENPRVVIYHN